MVTEPVVWSMTPLIVSTRPLSAYSLAQDTFSGVLKVTVLGGQLPDTA